MNDLVIQEINRFFTEQGLEEIQLNNKPASIKDSRIFKNKDGGYFLISKQGKSNYYLEDAETIEEVQNGVFEDMAAYKIGPGLESLINEIKNDIRKYILNSNSKVTADSEATIFRYAT